MKNKRPLKIYLAKPRGFCAGVDRAIKIVEEALERAGPPVYVRHEIVHNRHVVESLEAKGAVFVEELDDVPNGVPVILSAHGVAKSVPQEAVRRNLNYIDAICPLVSKVHREAERLEKEGYHTLLIGHAGHPEVIGTLGQVPEGRMTLIETEQDAKTLALPENMPLAYVTQTTLSVDDTTKIIAKLQERFPHIKAPKKEDICYATTNRQLAVKQMAPLCEALLVLGAPNSSNTKRLVECGHTAGIKKAMRIQTYKELDLNWLENVHTLGITAGASAPEILVQDLITHLSQHFDIQTQEVVAAEETTQFKLPNRLNGLLKSRPVSY